MKQQFRIGRYRFLGVAICFFLHAFPAYADEPNRINFQDALQGAVRVRINLMNPYVLYPIRLPDSVVEKAGCAYVSDDHAVVQDLLDALDGNEVKFDENIDMHFEFRNYINVGMGDGSSHIFLLSQVSRPPNSDVVTVFGLFDQKKIRASKNLINDLINWALRNHLKQIGRDTTNECSKISNWLRNW